MCERPGNSFDSVESEPCTPIVVYKKAHCGVFVMDFLQKETRMF